MAELGYQPGDHGEGPGSEDKGRIVFILSTRKGYWNENTRLLRYEDGGTR